MAESHASEPPSDPSWPTARVRGPAVRVDTPRPRPAPPGVGDTVEDCHLVAELGGGASGRVFLARQDTLSGRPLVLKLTAPGHEEHLNLARLQHTSIMPLYWTAVALDRGYRVLAMPYLGRATLARLLRRLDGVPVPRRTGRIVFDALQAEEDGLPLRLPVQDHPTHPLKETPWPTYVARVGLALAESLAYAHRQGVLHLDVKPSNVLITPDGTPVLLDLDVARRPVAAGASAAEWVGGTDRYASPEQRAAMRALTVGRPVPSGVDGRSDQYSLAVVLCEALGGRADDTRPCRTPGLSPGLAAILARCLAADPADRYPDCDALADDLDRHLRDLPLTGVRNRVGERWRKWRRRHPNGVLLVLLLVGFALTAGAPSVLYRRSEADRRGQLQAALLDGQEWQRKGEYAAAARRYEDGITLADEAGTADPLRAELASRLLAARRLQRVADLRQVVHLLRFHALQEQTPRRTRYVLAAAGRRLWADRGLLTDRSSGVLERAVEDEIHDHLRALVLLWADLEADLAPPAHKERVGTEVRQALRDAEQAFGPSEPLAEVQRRHGLAPAGPVPPPKTAWEHCALGRLALARGDRDGMDRHWRTALALDPAGFSSNFYAGVGALRGGRPDQAARAFAYCLGRDPCAECYLYRGMALAALGEPGPALADFDRAADLNPELGGVFAERGRVLAALGRRDEAARDRERARALSE